MLNYRALFYINPSGTSLHTERLGIELEGDT